MDDDVVDHFIEQQGAAAFAVEDGHVLVFTVGTLEELLARALESKDGRVIVFVKKQVAQ